MKKYKLLLLMSIFALTLSGCSSAKDTVDKNTSSTTSSVASLDDSFYPIVDLGTNINRESFYSNFYSTADFQTIGRELQVLSTSNFSTSDYYMSEGLQLKVADMQQLLRRSSNPDTYPYTLQPASGSTLEGVNNPIMVSSIYEQDYYQKDGENFNLAGLSLAIVIDPKGQNENGDVVDLTTLMSESVVNEYGRSTIEKAYNFLQSKKSLKDLPVTIAVYTMPNSDQEEYDGKFVYSSFCNGSVGDIQELNYDTYIFTSEAASTADGETAQNFAIFKSNVKNASTESVGIVGYGRYENDAIQSMQIQMTVNTKTYTELIYMIQTAADQLDEHFTGFDITVVVNSQDGLEAVIIKNNGQDAQSTLLGDNYG